MWWLNWRRQAGASLRKSQRRNWPTRSYVETFILDNILNWIEYPNPQIPSFAEKKAKYFVALGHQGNFQLGWQGPQWRSVKIRKFFVTRILILKIFFSCQEARMAAKLLEKKFGIKDVSWDNFPSQCFELFPRLCTGWNQRTRTMTGSWATGSSTGPSKSSSRSQRTTTKRRKSDSLRIANDHHLFSSDDS